MRSASPSSSRSTGPEIASKQAKRFRQRTDVADHDPELAFLAHRQLRGVVAQPFRVMQEHPRAFVKRSSGFGEHDAVSAAVQQAELQLALQILDRRGDGRLRAGELFGGGLEAAFADHSLEADQLMERQAIQHYSNIL